MFCFPIKFCGCVDSVVCFVFLLNFVAVLTVVSFVCLLNFVAVLTVWHVLFSY